MPQRLKVSFFFKAFCLRNGHPHPIWVDILTCAWLTLDQDFSLKVWPATGVPNLFSGVSSETACNVYGCHKMVLYTIKPSISAASEAKWNKDGWTQTFSRAKECDPFANESQWLIVKHGGQSFEP